MDQGKERLFFVNSSSQSRLGQLEGSRFPRGLPGASSSSTGTRRATSKVVPKALDYAPEALGSRVFSRRWPNAWPSREGTRSGSADYLSRHSDIARSNKLNINQLPFTCSAPSNSARFCRVIQSPRDIGYGIDVELLILKFCLEPL
ncbi:hypothetical protein STAS_01654 [Striga asiatica]|uniref:Uncharacterized protein n=1 Tax=Striga asiatica TaxID=4170 RepID=A0A5A7NZV1_STRAF|nr:hypothetical protein STAS_01654 [Striga asiatica]